MNRNLLRAGLATALAAGAATLTVVTAVGNDAGDRVFTANLVGYQEVPAVSTAASGSFRAVLDGGSVQWTLSYEGIEGDVQQAHIHVGDIHTAGGVSVFFCTNLGNGPTGTPACPQSGTISGVFDAGDVIGPAGQGVAAGEFKELLDAMRAGVAYANVHSTKVPAGEIRGQLR